MKLNPSSNFVSFLSAVQQCSGDVFFLTPEGDRLNLKSELCRYVFALVVSKPHLLESGILTCKNDEDIALLKDYLA